MIYNVLLVEDSTSTAFAVSSILEHGFESVQFSVTTVKSISAAEEILKNSPRFAVIILDLRLPNGMGEVSFLRIFSASNTDMDTEQEVRTPIIILTGDDTVAYSNKVLKHAQDFIMKPITNNRDFIRRVHRVILTFAYVKTDEIHNEIKEIINKRLEQLDEPPRPLLPNM